MSKKSNFALIIGIYLVSASAWSMTKITKVEFLGKSAPNQIIVSGDGPIEFEKIENTTDHQVILEIKNAKLAHSNVGRRLDASSFNSKVSLISPYNVAGQDAVRVIVQMREDATTSVVAQGNKLFMGVDGEPDTGVMAVASATESPGAEPSEGEAPLEASAPSESTESPTIKQFTDAQSNKVYIGRKITLQFRDAPVVDVFRLIGETSGFNIVLGPDVTGNITLSLIDVPWDLALDTVLNTLKLGAERTGSVMRVATLASITQEKQQILAAKAASEASAPRVTRIFPISYASPTSLVPLLQKFGAGNAGSGVANSRQDSILVDERTNSIVIQDISENIDRMAKIIELMDRPTPQVLIEAKIVEATEEFSKDLSGSLGAGTQDTTGRYFKGFSRNGDMRDPLTTGPLDTVSTASPPINQIGMGLKFNSLANFRLNALLNLNEAESKIKVISSPRTVVLNKEKASIIQGTPVLVPVTTLVNQVPILGSSVQSANLSLGVTPTVTNDGNVLLDLNVSSDTPKSIGEGQSGIGSRNITTKVVAESGSTLVIGGVYTQSKTRNEGGIPFLRKIPLLGLLFGSQVDIDNKSELFIFITPRILNEKDSSIASETQPPEAG
jgi:type IV pilus assembly protein PilQ